MPPSKFCAEGAAGEEFVRYAPYCCHDSVWLRFGVLENANDCAEPLPLLYAAAPLEP
jgi:hypothetical protein